MKSDPRDRDAKSEEHEEHVPAIFSPVVKYSYGKASVLVNLEKQAQEAITIPRSEND